MKTKIIIFTICVSLFLQQEALCLRPMAAVYNTAPFSRKFTINFKLHRRPLRNIASICKLLEDTCGIEISFRIPAVDIKDECNEKLKKPELTLPWYEIYGMEHLTHFAYIENFVVIIQSKGNEGLDKEVADRALDILRNMIYDKDIREFMPPDNIKEFKEDTEEILASGATPPREGGAYFYKHIIAIEKLAESMKQREIGLQQRIRPECPVMAPLIIKDIILQAA